ncbi:MAG: YihY/virulence factor BrkB family protein [Dehalococcoidia bacterium]|nr:MAG: YihY/virulence factor BrkB family protein [Dehalococcoidia bacterium]
MPTLRTLKLKFELLKGRFLQKPWGRLVVRTARKLDQDSAADMPAGLAYYSLLSVFPLLIGIIGLLGFIFPSELVQRELFSFFEENLPTMVGLLRENISAIIELRGTLGILGLVGLFWTGSALFGSIGRAMNRALGIKKPRPFYVRKLRDFIIGVSTGLIFFISLGLAAIPVFLPQATLPFGITLTAVITQILTLALIFLVFLLIYKYLPNNRARWQNVWPGALLGAVAFEVIRNLFAWYLDRFANFQLVYGGVASVIAFLVWVYLSAFTLIVGIELSSEYANMKRGE